MGRLMTSNLMNLNIYDIVKDGLKEIDNKMFFLVCDSYEVSEKGDFS